MTARELNTKERKERRERFLRLRELFKRERPNEKWVKLIAQAEAEWGRPISERMIYAIIGGYR